MKESSCGIFGVVCVCVRVAVTDKNRSSEQLKIKRSLISSELHVDVSVHYELAVPVVSRRLDPRRTPLTSTRTLTVSFLIIIIRPCTKVVVVT